MSATPSQIRKLEVEEKFRKLTRVILYSTLAGILFGAVAGLGPALIACKWEVIGTVALWLLASLALGLLAGFLFAIPKVLQEGGSANPPPSGGRAAANAHNDLPYALRVNTNLEQISDWLCKIIVGVGLVELKQIPGAIDQLADGFARGAGGTLPPAFGGALVVFFGAAGFLFGYLATRLVLSGEFARADRAAIGESTRQEIEEEVAKQLTDRVDDLDLRVAVNNARVVFKTKALPTTKEFEFAFDELVKVRKGHEGDRSAAIVMSCLYFAKQDYQGMYDVLTGAIAARVAKGSGEDVDTGDLHFNRAVAAFRLFKAGKAEFQAKTEESVKRAWELNEVNRTEWEKHDEWKEIAADAVFKGLFTPPTLPPPPAGAGAGGS